MADAGNRRLAPEGVINRIWLLFYWPVTAVRFC
jgi:hypothetical protein